MGKLTASAIALGTFVVGALAGYGVSEKFFRARLHAYQWTSVATMSNYVMAERFRGTPEAYEAALHEYLSALDTWKRADEGFTSPRALSVDKAMTYARLALLAADRNDASTAAKYWSQALALCPQIGWTTSCSADSFSELIHAVDDNSFMNPKRLSRPDHGS
jgi:tetratricopeptide (TPR) repeat protein